ncbi:MAG TPA: hypothetical protein PKY82_01685 [Pyrinomonadaceae bacterium]|nr:hypothetical protein [Pyrinomonadaceae bacterium]
MSKHTIQISDDSGQSFQMVVSIGFTGNSIGNWRSLEKGYIRSTQGRTEYRNSAADYTHDGNTISQPTVLHLLIFDNMQSEYYGMRLNDYKDMLGVNDQGMGYVWQPFVVNLKPYRISWVLVD